MKRYKFSIAVFAVALTSLFSGIAIRCVGFDGGAIPCTGQKVKPCANAVNATEACTWYSANNCQGEIIDAPYTTELTPGEPGNNMKESYNFAVCAYRYECTEGPSFQACVKGALRGRTFGKQMYNGGTCQQ